MCLCCLWPEVGPALQLLVWHASLQVFYRELQIKLKPRLLACLDNGDEESAQALETQISAGITTIKARACNGAGSPAMSNITASAC
jgi:hypothetical protein